MLGFLQITATVLNILPVPGFDGYGAIEPYLPTLNRAFFDVVFGFIELFGTPMALIRHGWDLFVFWR